MGSGVRCEELIRSEHVDVDVLSAMSDQILIEQRDKIELLILDATPTNA